MEDIYVGITFLIVFGGIPFAYQVGAGFRRALEARARRLADAQEHRQKVDMEKLRHANRIAVAEKLHEVLAISIADREMAGVIRDEIDRVHPNVRVAAEEEESGPARARRRSRGGT